MTTPSMHAHAAEYLQLWNDNPLTEPELAKLNTAAASLEVLLQGIAMEDSVLLNALIPINHLRGVDQ